MRGRAYARNSFALREAQRNLRTINNLLSAAAQFVNRESGLTLETRDLSHPFTHSHTHTHAHSLSLSLFHN